MSRISRRIAQNNVLFLAVAAVGVLKGLVVIPVLFRLLGEEGYGTYVLVLSSTSYGLIVATLGLDTALYRYLPARLGTDRGRALFNGVVQFAALWTLFFLALIVVFVAAMPVATPVPVLAISGAVICGANALFGLAVAYFRCQDRFLAFYGSATLQQLGEVGAVLAAAAYFRSVTGVFVTLAIYDAVVAIALLGFRLRKVGLVRWSGSDIARSLRFGVHSAINQAANTGYFLVDKIIMAGASGVAALAYYGPGFALAGILMQFAGAGAIALPTMIALAHDRGNRAEELEILQKSLRQLSLIAIPAAFGLIYVGQQILALMTNPDLAAKGYPVTVLLVAAFLLAGYNRLYTIAIRTHGASGFVNRVTVAHLLAFLAVVLSAVKSGMDPALSLSGGFLAVSVSQFFVLHVRVKNFVPGSYGWSHLAKPVAAALSMGVPLFWMDTRDLAPLAGYIVVAVGIYYAALYATGTFRFRDLAFLFGK